MKRLAVNISFALCLAWWACVGWHYAWPTFAFLFDLLEQRQGQGFAWASMSFTLTMLCWVYYAAAANLKRVIDNGTAPIVMQVLGYTLVLPPLLFLDWLVNMTVFTVLFWDQPASKSELVTGRLKRYAYQPEYAGTKRRKAAHGFALILDALDPSGIHI